MHARLCFFALGLSLLLAACQAWGNPAATESTHAATATEGVAVTTSSPPSLRLTEPPATSGSDDWQKAPVIPERLSDRAKEIYAQGLALGRDPHVFSKVGDCGGTPSWFLGVFDEGQGEYHLGEYEDLADVIGYFQGSYSRESLAVQNGFSTASILSPIRANPQFCESGENPLACEYRLNNPSIALIMVGTNDVYHVDDFEGRMRQIIEYTIDQGILPVLASKADNLEGDQEINRIIFALAQEYEIPYWNYWRALQGLPNKGLQSDGAHITFAPNYFDNEYDMTRGWPWRNLTALQMLDLLKRGLVK